MIVVQSTPQPGSKRASNRTSDRDTRALLAAIEAAGGELRPCRSRTGHYKVYLDGRLIGTIAGTPSEYRSRKNDIANLRRQGLQITSKGAPIT